MILKLSNCASITSTIFVLVNAFYVVVRARSLKSRKSSVVTELVDRDRDVRPEQTLHSSLFSSSCGVDTQQTAFALVHGYV
jgi:hypothetical protein